MRFAPILLQWEIQRTAVSSRMTGLSVRMVEGQVVIDEVLAFELAVALIVVVPVVRIVAALVEGPAERESRESIQVKSVPSCKMRSLWAVPCLVMLATRKIRHWLGSSR